MSYQEDLILSIYGRGEPGLAMADPLPKGPDRDKPVQAPGKDGTPSSPYLPGKSPMPSKLANLADGEPDASIMNYVTENGFFLDGQGKAYMQGGGKFQDAGDYNPDIHGLPVPLAQQMQINPNVAMYSGDEVGSGVIIPQDFSPLPFRYFQHIRTPEIRQRELDHFNNFIESMGGGFDRVQNPNSMMISQVGVGAPHSNVQIDTGEDITTGETYKRVLPNYGAGRIKFPVRPKKL